MALNIPKEVATMQRQSVHDLRDRYYEVFGEETQARNKQWLIKRIAWKLQANEEGDISERARRLAMEIAQSTDIRTSAPKLRRPPITQPCETATTIITPPADSRLPMAGTVLVKSYKGRSVQVRVLPNSFEYEGEQYKSLTAIARIVTGQKNINGFQFFKLGKAETTA
jgi:hypothetical protein